MSSFSIRAILKRQSVKPVVKRQIAPDSYHEIVSVNTRNRKHGCAYVNPFNADPSKRDGTERGGEEMFCPRPCRGYE